MKTEWDGVEFVTTYTEEEFEKFTKWEKILLKKRSLPFIIFSIFLFSVLVIAIAPIMF